MPKIARAEAVVLAKAAVLAAGLDWEEPVSVSWGLFTYAVWTNAGVRDGNTIIEVNRRSGVATVVGRTGRRSSS